MTFEEWYDLLVEWTGYEPAQSAKALAKAAWEAGYVAGMKDVPTAEYEPPKGYVLVTVEEKSDVPVVEEE